MGENVKRAHYKMSRVLEVYHGSDRRVRSALVKTEDGKLKRPVVKLAPLFYESVFGRQTVPAMLAPVIRRPRKMIQIMLVEKQELNLCKLRIEGYLIGEPTPSRSFLDNY